MGFSTSLIALRRKDGAPIDAATSHVPLDRGGAAQDGAWLLFRYRDSAAYPSELFALDASAGEALSKKHGEAVLLVAHANVDQLAYEHAVDGVVVRKLIAVGDGEPWEARGTAEPWETQWLGADVENGASEPSVDATVAQRIVQHFGMTTSLLSPIAK